MSGAAADPSRRRRRRRRFWWIALVLVAVAVAAFFAVRGGRGVAATDVVVETLEQGRFVRETTGSGVVEAVRERSLAFRSGGSVAEVFVEEGDAVVAGEPLLRLDVAELERSIASTRSALASARAELERTVAQLRVDRLDLESAVAQADDRRLQAESDVRSRDADVARVERLLELGAASRDELRSARDARDAAARALEQATLSLETARSRLANQQSLIDAQRSSAEAQVSQLETDLANLLARLDEAELVAPFDGVIATLAVEQGDTAGTEPVVTVADPSELRVRASFDENRAGQLAVNQAADVVPDADTRARLAAAVARLAPVAARDGGSAQVEAILSFDQNVAGDVRPGYTVTVRVRISEREEALLMPLEAISEPEDGAPFAFLVEPGEEDGAGVARRVEIEILDRNATVAALEPGTSDFAVGALVAVVGVDALSDGARVAFPPVGTEGGRASR